MVNPSNGTLGKIFPRIRLFKVLPLLILAAFLLGVSPAPQPLKRVRVTRFFINVSDLPGVLCTGTTYSIITSIKPLVELEARDRNQPPIQPRTSSHGIRITASVTDKNVATVLPPQVQIPPSSGASVANNSPSTGDDDELPPLPRTAVFHLSPLKSGAASLELKGSVPKRISHTALDYPMKTIVPFEVADCNYTFSMHFNLRNGPKDGTFATVGGGMHDGKLLLDPNTHKITGTGELESFELGHEYSGYQECDNDPTSTKNQVDVTGALANHQLVLNFAFQKSSFPVVARCAIIEISGARNPLPPTTRTHTLFGVPSYNKLDGIEFSEDGGTVTKRLPLPDIFVEYIITVTPQKSSGK